MSEPKREPETGQRRYGCWAGNPRGTAEDKECCIESVWPNTRGAIQHQCCRKRGYGPNGEYCKQHSPEYLADKEAKQRREGELKRKAEDERWARHEYNRLAGEYCRRRGMKIEELT